MAGIQRIFTAKLIAAFVLVTIVGISLFWGWNRHTAKLKHSIHAQNGQLVVSNVASVPATPSAPTAAHNKSRPLWSDLKPVQRQVLAPLAPEWDELEAFRKKKWLEIAAKYPKMPVDEQQRMQTRMQEWVRLTPEQRRIARESYARTKKLDTNQKTAKWQQYQQLPEDEKQKLVAVAEQKKNVANLPRSKKVPAAVSGPAPSTVIPSPAAEPVGAMPMPIPAAPDQSESLGGPPSYLIN